MFQQHKNRGLRILAFPCNQFANEEPWEEAKILKFVQEKFGVQFDMMEKVDVVGDKTHSLYRALKERLPSSEIDWNFAKYLLDGQGEVIKFFAAPVDPSEVLADAEHLLS